MRVLLDTNVILDSMLQRAPWLDEALLEFFERKLNGR